MSSLADINPDALLTLMKGEPGTRKSTAALTYPTPQYWIAPDNKMSALLAPAKHYGISLAEISYNDADCYNWDSIIKKMKELQTKCPYKTVIIDSVTSCADTIGRQIVKAKRGTTNAQGGEKGGSVGGLPINTIEDYKAENFAFNELISVSLDIRNHFGIHVIFIAHVVGSRETKSDSISTETRIIITGGKTISGKIPAYTQEAYHFDVKPGQTMSSPPEFKCYTSHTGGDYARTTLPIEREINWGGKNFYKEFIGPAITKLKG